MQTRTFAASLIVAVGAALALVRAQPVTTDTTSTTELERAFGAPPDDARVMMRWWWFGPAVTPAGLDRDLMAMREAGLGGVEVQPVYPLALDDGAAVRTLPFLSAGFLDALGHARATASGLGLRFDLTLGSGWPFGGPSVSAADASAALRVVKRPLPAGTTTIGLPRLEGGESYLAVYLTADAATDVRPDGFTPVDLGRVHDGLVPLPAPLAAAGLAWVFVQGRTGMQVKRPAVGGEGFVLNHYDRQALARYLDAVGTPMLGVLASSRPYAIFCDSLEAYGGDWTPDLPAAFERRYGYDLRDHLPSLVAGDDAASRGVRHDWAQLLTERLESAFLEPLLQWAHEHDTRLRVQTYGIPPAVPSSARFVDLPEGEGAAWRTVTSARWASSAAHVYGRPVASSETWTWLHSPAFAATPLDIKAEADRHFLQGITQLIGHGWPNTPGGVEWPGARFYAAAVLSDANPWWIVMPDLARYLQRTSALLRQGRAVTDVAVYAPIDDAWSRMRPGSVHMFDMLRTQVGTPLVASLLDTGFTFDVVDDRQLVPAARIEGRELVVGEARYKAVVLPGVEIISPSTMDLFTAFARAGGVVVASRRAPSMAPGFKAGPQQHGHVARASATLFTGAPGAPAPTGRLVERDEDVGRAIAARIAPDVRWGAHASGLGFVHRRVGAADVYFLANTTNRAVTTRATFRSAGPAVEMWDLHAGTRRPHASSAEAGGRAVALRLEPYASVAFVVHAGPPGAPRPARPCEGSARVLDLSTGWQITVPGGAPRPLAALTSWHELPDSRFLSGVVTYTRAIDLPSVPAGGCPVWLDFGEGTPREETPLTNGMRAWLDAPVRDGAVVAVNGTVVGSAWAPPYRVDLSRAVRPGRNTLEVRVGNTALNGWAARPPDDYRLLHLRYGKRFDPQDMDKVEPQPSGLIGTVRVLY